MEINILGKFFTNKSIFVFLCLVVFLFGCQTNNTDIYVRPDFTDTEILANEIQRLESRLEDEVLNVLWNSNLLYTETNTDLSKNLYNKSIEYAQTQFFLHAENERWLEALKISRSLITENQNAHKDLQRNFSQSFLDTHKNVLKEYNSLAQLSSSTNAQSTMSTFITGVVTIWVDLGVKVENGRGVVNRKLGSGFFIDDRGYIITNHHVIEELVDPEYEGYGRLYIKLSSDNETRIPATVIGWDKTLDIALIKTEISVPYVFKMGTSENLEVGNSIYAIGSPVGLENTITSGIISAFDRNLLSTAAVMQIDAAVNSGNSGGPLINDRGEVQGVVFAGLASYQGLNFAIPIEYVHSILSRLYSSGEINHSWMGAYGRTIKNIPSDVKGVGVEIMYVMPSSSAHNANIEKGNIVTSINGTPISSIEDLQFLLIQLAPNTIVSLGLKENKDSIEKIIPMYLDIRPENPGYAIYEREPDYKMIYPIFGMELIPSSVGNRNQYTVQSIIKGSIADESGFSVHDPVELLRTTVTNNKDIVFIETFTKKRKSGYFEVSVSVGAPLDSLYLF